MSSSSSNSITAADVREWFSAAERGETRTFFMEHVDENVHWTVTTPADGPLGKTTPIAGIYETREAFMKIALGGISNSLAEPLKLKVVDVLVQPSDRNPSEERHLTKACIELAGTSKMKNGTGWSNHYSWVMHFDNESKKAVRVRAYLDSAAVNLAMEKAN